jgi:hypothetical protein
MAQRPCRRLPSCFPPPRSVFMSTHRSLAATRRSSNLTSFLDKRFDTNLRLVSFLRARARRSCARSPSDSPSGEVDAYDAELASILDHYDLQRRQGDGHAQPQRENPRKQPQKRRSAASPRGAQVKKKGDASRLPQSIASAPQLPRHQSRRNREFAGNVPVRNVRNANERASTAHNPPESGFGNASNGDLLHTSTIASPPSPRNGGAPQTPQQRPQRHVIRPWLASLVQQIATELVAVDFDPDSPVIDPALTRRVLRILPPPPPPAPTTEPSAQGVESDSMLADFESEDESEGATWAEGADLERQGSRSVAQREDDGLPSREQQRLPQQQTGVAANVASKYGLDGGWSVYTRDDKDGGTTEKQPVKGASDVPSWNLTLGAGSLLLLLSRLSKVVRHYRCHSHLFCCL